MAYRLIILWLRRFERSLSVLSSLLPYDCVDLRVCLAVLLSFSTLLPYGCVNLNVFWLFNHQKTSQGVVFFWDFFLELITLLLCGCVDWSVFWLSYYLKHFHKRVVFPETSSSEAYYLITLYGCADVSVFDCLVSLFTSFLIMPYGGADLNAFFGCLVILRPDFH